MMNSTTGYLLCQSCPTLWDPMDCSSQTPLFVGFPRQEYWGGMPFPPLGNLHNSRIKPTSLMFPALAGRFFLPLALPGKLIDTIAIVAWKRLNSSTRKSRWACYRRSHLTIVTRAGRRTSVLMGIELSAHRMERLPNWVFIYYVCDFIAGPLS